jgi:chromosome segregation ATPase
MKFVVDDIARITFPKSLRDYSEEDVNNFIKKIRADYRDYDLQLGEKDQEIAAQEKRFIDRHKEKRREFDQALRKLSSRLEQNESQIARLEAEGRSRSSSSRDLVQLEARLSQALENLSQNQQKNVDLRSENADYQAQLEVFKRQPIFPENGLAQNGLAQLKQELESLRREKQSLQAKLATLDQELVNSGELVALRGKFDQQETELTELRRQLDKLKKVEPDPRPMAG